MGYLILINDGVWYKPDGTNVFASLEEIENLLLESLDDGETLSISETEDEDEDDLTDYDVKGAVQALLDIGGYGECLYIHNSSMVEYGDDYVSMSIIKLIGPDQASPSV